MISLLAAVASPSFVKIMRDIGLSRMTMQLAEIYRRAYVDSSERETSLVRFRYQGAGLGTPLVETRRARIDTAPLTLAAPRRCNAINWDDPTIERQVYNLQWSGLGEYVDLDFTNNGALHPMADVCFSRRHAFIRYDEGSFADMTTSARVGVKNLKTGLVRRVFIPTNGLPRLAQ